MTSGQPSLLRIGVSACFMHPDPMRPVFKGKTLLYAEESMLRWISRAGALPLLVPPAAGPVAVRDIVRAFDGLVLQGGADVAPGSYGEEPARPEWGGDAVRDGYEIALIRAAVEEDRPVLGICRGLQVLNVALGGSLYQDLATFHPGHRVHRSWEVYDHLGHDIAVEPGSALAGWCPQAGPLRVNSVHHQGIKDLAPGLVVEARAVPDGVIEAVRYAPRDTGTATAAGGGGGPFAYGVQWHPEFMQDVTPDVPEPAAGPVLDSGGVLDAFLAEVRRRRAARTLAP